MYCIFFSSRRRHTRLQGDWSSDVCSSDLARKRADFPEVLHARELGKLAHEAKQMTTAQAVGAVSREAAEWYAIDWRAINRNVRRLQVRIVQATKASRWGRVRALQRLLTHSYSGKVLAVRRVTENNGKKTPGVDQEIWDTPEKKTQAVHALKHRGYQSQPLRRVYIPKSDGKTMRPLGIPTMKDRAQQALYLLALAPVRSEERRVGKECRSRWSPYH